MMKFEVFNKDNDKYFFRVVDDEGNILLLSEGYELKENVLTGIESVKHNVSVPTGIEKQESREGEFFFNVISAKGQVEGTSAKFDTAEYRDKWLNDIQIELPQLQVVDI